MLKNKSTSLKTKSRHGSRVIKELIASRLFSSFGSVSCAQGIQSRIFSPTVQPMDARDRSGHNYAHQVK
uniref:Uncharacterized protein n=1 Tax=Triticum urartu TaxID=4572 RepID=A0A8R7R2K3_TRIUA